MSQTKTLRGSDLQIFINGVLFAVATGIRYQMDTGHRSIMGIDQYTPFEIAPGPCSVKGNIDCTRQYQDGGLEGRGITAPEASVMLEKYFSLAVVDRTSDTVILAIDEAIASNQSWTVTPKGMVTGSFSFEGLAWTTDQ